MQHCLLGQHCGDLFSYNNVRSILHIYRVSARRSWYLIFILTPNRPVTYIMV